MLTVIIPALNEENTIASVIKFCLSVPDVTQVIVVDDKSEDNTVSIAKESGADISAPDSFAIETVLSSDLSSTTMTCVTSGTDRQNLMTLAMVFSSFNAGMITVSIEISYRF